ncbi:MAG: HPr family phosphocarrier protein [Lachnospiraceae bacterium]|nr:HPr family phosphocarrier protein [Lachnospiraceae bacterium]
MVSKSVTVKNPSGIHARPAGELAKIAKACTSEVFLIKGEKKVKAKSVMSILTAAISNGTEITVECEGPDEEKDLETIVNAIESGLGE